VGSAVGCSVGRDVGAGLGGRVVVSTPMELVSTTTDEPRSAATAVWKSELERSEVVLVASAETSLFSVTKSKADVQTTLDDRRRRRLRFCLLRLNEYVNVQPRMESVLTPSWVATVCLSVAESASVGAAEAAKSRDTLSVTVVPSVGCADTLGSNVGCGYGAPLGSGVGESVGSAVGASEGSAEGAAEGANVGRPVGASEGFDVGASVGTPVGSAVGASEGSAVGASVGTPVGTAVGASEGSVVGASVGTPVGSAVGAGEGSAVGRKVGNSVGTIVGRALG
jgi:hypothetical protein